MTFDKIDFKSNGFLTLGIEVELQILNKETLDLEPKLLKILDGNLQSGKIKKELFLSTIEINTDICDDVHQIEKDLNDSCDLISDIGNELDVDFAFSASHPFAKYIDATITDEPRYRKMIEDKQWLAKRTSVFGMHIHLGMRNGDDCIKFSNFFFNFIPHLIALSASSPFWQGINTGLASSRQSLFESLPICGLPYHMENWQDFEYIYNILKKSNSIDITNDIWWDIRPSPNFGTLEIRVCDGLTLEEILAISSFVQLLAKWFDGNRDFIENRNNHKINWIGRENKWRALRYGLDAKIIIDNKNQDSTKEIKQDIMEWIEKITPYDNDRSYSKYIGYLKKIIRNGNSSDRQLEIYKKNQSLKDVVKLNISEFKNRKSYIHNINI